MWVCVSVCVFPDGQIPLRQLKPKAMDCYTLGMAERTTQIQMGLWTEMLADTDTLLSAKYFSHHLDSSVSLMVTLALVIRPKYSSSLSFQSPEVSFNQ